MRIQHNIAALNAYRNLTNNNSAVSKNLEKLSSGYKINRAGDDAAGLAISEKMRAQITGLNTAQKNANDGISLVQTAEGALTEVHSMLNRMVELANQSANGTYADAPDRENLQAEITSLLDEVNRISEATNFNGIRLLDGSLGLNGDAFKIGDPVKAAKETITSGADLGVTMTSDTHKGSGATEQKPEFTVDFADLKVNLQANTSTAAAGVDTAMTNFTIGGKDVTIHDNTTDAAAGTESTAIKFNQAAAANSVTPQGATSKSAADVAGLMNGKYAVIEGDVYLMTATAGSDGSNSALKFEYKGKIDSNTYYADTTDEGKVSTDTWTPTGNVVIEFDDTNATTSLRDNCHLTNVKDPVAGTDPARAGAKLTLTTDMLEGKLTIGNREFTFNKNKTAAEAGTNEIGLKGVADADLLKEATRQLSNKGDVTITKDGKSYAFTIGRGSSTSEIEIEEKVKTATAPAKPEYGDFTEAELQEAFSLSAGAANASRTITLNNNPKEGDSITIGNKTYTFKKDPAQNDTTQIKIGATAADSAKNLADAIKNDTGLGGADLNGTKITVYAKAATDEAPTIGSKGLVLQIGDTSEDFNQMKVTVKSMSAASLGINDIDISTQSGAAEAVDKIKAAINQVSSQRGDLGAVQNRLEHTINNLSVTAENMTAAESRIRDVDMAEEMMAYTKNNILVQAAQAMLAQANQVPQGVLQLLQ